MRRITKVATTSISLALALTLTSCSGAGPDAATRMIKRVTDGNEAVIKTNGDDIRISNLLVVATSDSAAVVVGNIVNRSDEADQLLTISAGGANSALSGETVLRKNKPLFFEGDSANAKAVFAGVNPVPGQTIDLTLGFARAGMVTVTAIIRDQRDVYAGVTSAPITAAAK
jgi:copper(I)-binding protein